MMDMQKRARELADRLRKYPCGEIVNEAIDFLRTLAAQPAEPVAWMYTRLDGPEKGKAIVRSARNNIVGYSEAVPLYAAPPQASTNMGESKAVDLPQSVSAHTAERDISGGRPWVAGEQVARPSTPAQDAAQPCDDSEAMKLWRKAGLPEYFLGNGGTNNKLVRFVELVRATPPSVEDERAARDELRNIVNAKRFDRKVFDDDTAFADWAVSRARAALKGAK